MTIVSSAIWALNAMYESVDFFGTGRVVAFKIVLNALKFFPPNDPLMTFTNIVLGVLSVVSSALMGERIKSIFLLYQGIPYIFFV